MMYVGIDHGTSGIKVAACDGERDPEFLGKAPRRKVAEHGLLRSLPDEARRAVEEAECICLNYGMGDALTEFTPLEEAEDLGLGYGLRDTGGSGQEFGAGRRMVEELSELGVEAYLAPGIHRDLPRLDGAFRIFSHVASGEKLGTARLALELSSSDDLVVCDTSSNTVSVVVKDGEVIGGIDACLGAPGILQGPLDLEAIRRIDAGELSANEAFSTGGIVKVVNCAGKDPESAVEEFIQRCGKEEKEWLARLVAWEVVGLGIVYDCDEAWIGGTLSGDDEFMGALERVLSKAFNRVAGLPPESASMGLALIAADIASGARSVLGVRISRRH
ncbi:methanogenesis marker 12 protein [Methanopyrus sp. KOL6]|uniref:methanogenesis marker 12 protein n=1 Tax=Methanopyrus sp. KOL6 TaxID=1937004 RepID=UPI000B4B6B2E|nr:methanogenesis marker 12 protein [Methanopyrus sp. KOL6]